MQWPLAISTALLYQQQPISKMKTKKLKKNKDQGFLNEKSKKAFEVEYIFREIQLYYKVHWLGYNIIYKSWVNKEDTEEKTL